MAGKTDSTELDIARRARAAARERSAERIGTPNLTRSGKEKGLVSPTPQARPKSAAALKKEYGNGREKSVKQVEREIVGDSITMKGKARAVTAAQGNVGQKKQALKLQPTLTVPMARNSRAANKDGATSFHFKHEAIARTKVEKTSASGTKTRKNAGRDHSKYLERDSAVARNGEVVERIGQEGEGKEVADALGRAAAGGLYIEREEALAHQENGVAVIYSNISQDAEERHRFWDLVEQHETQPNPDHLKIVTGQAPEFWEAVRTDPRCPKQLALAIEEADPAKPYRVQTDDNEFIREIMADHGWAPPSPRRPNETDEEKEARETLDQANGKGAECQDGRGGHIQNRIVGELPYEVSHEQRIRILRRFAADFDEKNLPYVAVMHAPDHANNDKNWHFHLAYYERPCSRFTGEAEDYLGQKPKDNWRAEAMYDVKAKALASGDLEKYVGQWDFAVPVEVKTKSRNTRVSYPFAQDKIRECNKQDWPLKLRQRLAEITNDELEIAGSARRVDPRRFAEMGIDKEAEQHLGSRSAQMESLGIATPRGVENEHRQWQFTLDRIDKKFKADERNTANEERRWRQTLESRALNPSDHSEVSKLITRWAQTQSEANEQTAIAAELKQHYERAQSRAKKVEETCKRHLEAINAGQASKRQGDNKSNYQARLVEASDHLAGLTIIMASEIIQEKRSREEAAKLTEEANKLRSEIDKRLKDEMAAMMAAPGAAKGKEKKKAGAANDAGTIAANDDGKAEAKPVLDRSEADHSLKQFEVERFMKHLVDNNRRLVKDGKYLVPVNPTEYETKVITARNYVDHQARLRKLKVTQDEHIDRLSKHILDHPEVIKVVPGKAGANAPSYELMSKDGSLQRTFKGFADDALVKTAIEAALEARQNASGGAKQSAATNEADRAPAGSQAAVASPSIGTAKPDAPTPSAASPDPVATTKGPSRAEIMRKVDDIAAAVTPIIRDMKDGKPHFRLAEQDLKTHGLANGDLAAVPVQTRLRGIHKQQEGDIKRLVGFIRRSPGRTTTSAPTLFSNNEPTIELARNAPADLRALSQKYARHPVAQQQMSEALRSAKPDPEKAKTTEAKPAAEKTVLPKAEPRPKPAKAEAPKVERQKAEPPAPVARKSDTAPSEGIDMSQPVEVRTERPGHKPARVEDQDKPVAPAKEPTTKQSAADKPQADKPATPSARPQPARVPTLTAEERAELLRPRKFGASGGSEPAAVAAKVEEVVQSGEKPTSIPRGAHPKIDAWIAALDARDREARQEAALALKNDRKALKIALDELDAKTQARIRMDWEAQQAKIRDDQAKEAERKKSGLRNLLP